MLRHYKKYIRKMKHTRKDDGGGIGLLLKIHQIFMILREWLSGYVSFSFDCQATVGRYMS